MLLGSIFFLVAAALIPPLILLFIIYRMDKIEREPVHLLLSLFLQGAIAMVPILILELIGDRIIGIFSWSQMLYLFFAYFVIPGFVEEGVKYLVVMRRAERHVCAHHRLFHGGGPGHLLHPRSRHVRRGHGGGPGQSQRAGGPG